MELTVTEYSQLFITSKGIMSYSNAQYAEDILKIAYINFVPNRACHRRTMKIMYWRAGSKFTQQRGNICFFSVFFSRYFQLFSRQFAKIQGFHGLEKNIFIFKAFSRFQGMLRTLTNKRTDLKKIKIYGTNIFSPVHNFFFAKFLSDLEKNGCAFFLHSKKH